MSNAKNTPTVTLASKLVELENMIQSAFQNAKNDPAAITAVQVKITKAGKRLSDMRAKCDEYFDTYLSAAGSDSLPGVVRMRKITETKAAKKVVEVDTSLDF